MGLKVDDKQQKQTLCMREKGREWRPHNGWSLDGNKSHCIFSPRVVFKKLMTAKFGHVSAITFTTAWPGLIYVHFPPEMLAIDETPVVNKTMHSRSYTVPTSANV